jgi:hypothetical protein
MCNVYVELDQIFELSLKIFFNLKKCDKIGTRGFTKLNDHTQTHTQRISQTLLSLTPLKIIELDLTLNGRSKKIKELGQRACLKPLILC